MLPTIFSQIAPWAVNTIKRVASNGDVVGFIFNHFCIILFIIDCVKNRLNHRDYSQFDINEELMPPEDKNFQDSDRISGKRNHPLSPT